MALIFAVVSSVIGLIAGSLGMLFFGASFLSGFGIYVVTSLAGIVLGSVLIMTPRRHLLEALTEEDVLDEVWMRVAAETAMTDEEDAFQDMLNRPLSDRERRGAHDRNTG